MRKKTIMLIIMSSLAVLSIIVAAFELDDKDSEQSVYAKYYFTPAFKASIPFDPSHLRSVEDDAKALVKVLGNPSLTEQQFGEGLKGNLTKMNSRDNGFIWAHSEDCGSEPLDPAARKVVFCVRFPDRLFMDNKGWSSSPLTLRFSLDFSEDAYLTANGNRPKKCIDGTPYAACSTISKGKFCDADQDSDYVLVQDCRGFDKKDSADDCGCLDSWVCGSDGVCTGPI